MVTEDAEPMGEHVRAAMVGQHAGHADNYRSDQNDQAENDEHDTLLELMDGIWG